VPLFGVPELIIVVILGLPLAGVVLFWVILGRRATRFAYASTRAYLRAAPRSDAEKRDAADLMVRAREGAEEVTQDAFVRAYTHLDHYDDHRPFYPWLATIAVRLAQNWLRQQGRIVRREGAPLERAQDAGAAAAALTALIANQRSRRLWQAVAALPLGNGRPWSSTTATRWPCAISRACSA
jgi:RNA polymerase sigma factor (sigma-70 family)